jgi:hypothetical protein
VLLQSQVTKHQHPTCWPIINAHFQHLKLIKTTFEWGQLMEHLHTLPHTINKQQLSSSTMEQKKSEKEEEITTNISTTFQVPQNKKRQSDKKFAKLLQNSIDSLSNNVVQDSANLLSKETKLGPLNLLNNRIKFMPLDSPSNKTKPIPSNSLNNKPKIDKPIINS